ncbi:MULTISPECIES: GNAT family N-acetyltransferase [Chryseobacterium]|uniref:Ribosomal protein S18 acetylase RimI-like enzyme n=1 Tax=Chryseobacterium camelliae TaxID=1265445 RepID=A0ABU0TKK5_9FLAO|nr:MULTISPECIES: GNAT family N-acetyltransferase [Chryseobacterium]MDT3408557.1 ribosomal protein S18 acetylase RimI-like enzyme [Pseudacidovorax intermedius]MDQ1097588.1 ribosomal protein S18 acetylase RimI-like enzyme [Chryseobacterium camelliae]MDQ1101517.1 ribosomal protein S18 acetylase RimI-like enzyme [Chryseobacterium sp. SORGH_AS_1048]MDR6084960.1 ribosomal protein S18 acetylase RimI-like enzyme [Chryseobacterium sp. SORGH_AS_0909]MDR6129313.1 ribosomal protein S18 acetylase RimI-like
MKITDNSFIFKQLGKNDKFPYELLLLADPSKKMIDTYIRHSEVFTAVYQEETIGVIALFPLEKNTAEIKNIAVKPEFQQQGIGTFLIENTFLAAKNNGMKSIMIGTANSSIGQLLLYQKLGFEMTEIKRNFFLDHYAETIFENGIQAKHMVVLERSLK